MSASGFVHHVTARFRDADPFGHVNNAAYLTYIEEARIAFMRHLGILRTLDDMTMILARAEIDFRAEAAPGDEVAIGVRPSRFGTKSFDLEYELRVGDRVVAEAKTVLVGYDYARRETIPIPDDWRRRFAA
jgi:acyl-CoA thioester hydrolase